jgi:PKD domain-containing protein
MNMSLFAFPFRGFRFGLMLVFAASIPLWHASSQLAFTVDDLVLNWPEVEIHYTVSCDYKWIFSQELSEDLFDIHEDGLRTDFRLEAPDSVDLMRPVSLALIVDAGAKGIWATNQQLISELFIGWLRPSMGDEAVIYQSTNLPHRMTAFSSNPLILKNAVQSIQDANFNRLFDAVEEAVDDLSNEGSNAAKHVVLISAQASEWDNTQISEIIAAAQAANIVIHCIQLTAFGSFYAQHFSRQTGGEWYQIQHQDDIDLYVQRLNHIVFLDPSSGVLRYISSCPDGTERNISVSFSNDCGQSHTLSRQYTAALQSKSADTIALGFVSDSVSSENELILPLHVFTPLTSEQVFNVSVFELRYNPETLAFVRINTLGYLWQGAAVSAVEQTKGRVSVSVDRSYNVQGTLSLCDIIFTVNEIEKDTVVRVDLQNWIFSHGCLVADPQHAVITVRKTPVVSALGPTHICTGDSVILVATNGFVEYHWSNGVSGDRITVHSSGEYSVTVVDNLGTYRSSKPVKVVVASGLKPKTIPEGVVALCDGSSVILKAEQGYASYQWSNGARTQEIEIDTVGEYVVFVGNWSGCSGYSDTIRVIHTPLPAPVIIGPDEACLGSIVEYKVPLEADHSYHWTAMNGSISKGQGSATVTVQWREGEQGSIHVRATNTRTACTGEELHNVILTAAPHIALTTDRDPHICDGEFVRIQAPAGYTSYQWSTGDSSNTIDAYDAGVYFVNVSSSEGCTIRSDTIRVIVQALQQPDIRGEFTTCPNETLVYYTDVVPNHDYEWQIEGGVILDGKYTNTVTIRWVKSTAAVLRLIESVGGCSVETEKTVSVHETETPAIEPSGDQWLCDGESIVLRAGDGYKAYKWSNGAVTQSISVQQQGRYYVAVETELGCSDTSGIVEVFYYPTAALPVITLRNDTLTCSEAESYIWYFNAEKIVGATSQSLLVDKKGTYMVEIVNEYGCHIQSAPFVVTSVGIPVYSAHDYTLQVYPSITKDDVSVEITANAWMTFRLSVSDLLGRDVMSREIHQGPGKMSYTMPLGTLRSGVYIVRIQNDKFLQMQKFVKH